MAQRIVPSVYCVVLNWNQPEVTSDCLRSLAGQDYPSCHVVVVDNGSTDGSATLLRGRFGWVSVLEIPQNVGYSRGNNVGIEWALKQGADYILLLNNDTEVHARMLSQLVEVAESEPGVGIVGPTMYYAEPSNMVWGAENRIDWRLGREIRGRMGQVVDAAELEDQPAREVDYVDTCACLVKREVFERVGLMDGDYFINFDDLDLNTRARNAGFRVVYFPPARMWHRVSAVMGLASPATTYYMTRNSLLFFWRYAPGLFKLSALVRIMTDIVRTVSAWTVKPRYQSPDYRRRRNANLLAVRDFFLGRFGRMGDDVAHLCYGGEAS